MSIAQRLPTDPQDVHDEFASIEAAVAGTARGRWFLDEYVRRAQNRDNERIIATLTRIERMLTAQAQAKPPEARTPESRQLEPRQLEPRQSEPRQSETRQSETRETQPARSAAAVAPSVQGAALPVLSALRASGALAPPVPAPRPAPVVSPSPARSLAETLEQALLATQPQAGVTGTRPDVRKPEPIKSEPMKPEPMKPAAAPIPAPAEPSVARSAPFVARAAEVRAATPSPYLPPGPPRVVPPAPPLVEPPASALSSRAPLPPSWQREASAPSLIDAKAFAQIEAMDAATRAKLFA